MLDSDKVALFALQGSQDYGKKIAANLRLQLAVHEERDFEDGEHKIRPMEAVRNKDVFVIQSLYQDRTTALNEKLCRLLFFIGALKDASAKSVTAVVPYLCYARKDRKTQLRDPVTTRYIAQLFEAVGMDKMVTLDVHNLQAYQNSFRTPSEHLEGRRLFTEYFAGLDRMENITIMSPDIGGIKRAEKFRYYLERELEQEIEIAFTEKYREKGKVSGGTVIGEIKGRTVIIIDDLISTGTTILRAAQSCRSRGANRVFAAATHGVFTGNYQALFESEHLEKIIITDSILPHFNGNKLPEKLEIIETAPLFAEVIKRIHTGSSVMELMEV